MNNDTAKYHAQREREPQGYTGPQAMLAEIGRLSAAERNYHAAHDLQEAKIERLRAALKPFAELYGPYRYDGTTDSEIVRSAGTLGKDGDRGYAFITVADLRRANEALGQDE